jgi:hypothetical protein
VVAEEKKEPWLNWLALSTVILAVCATLSTFKAGGYSTRSVMNQSKASSQWSYYQSKSIKGYLYELQKDQLALEAAAMRGGKGSPAALAAYDNAVAGYAASVARYEREKGEIEAEARALEKARDDASLRSGLFGKAVIFLQIAILLSSIAALLKKKPVWYLSLAAGAVGLVQFADGFFLFLP